MTAGASTNSGEPLPPISGWDIVTRGSFAIEHSGEELVVDVDYFDFSERIRLYRAGQLLETRSSPATFSVDETTRVEAEMSLLGMKRVDLVDTSSAERLRFQPRSGTGEAWRAELANRWPRLNRALGVASWSVLAFSLLTQLPVYFNMTVGRLVGAELPTFDFLAGVNTALSVAGVIAALDRALQLKYNRWLDD
ncbi:hypothetical protein [Leucobacter komagatae]|uniref:Uncharacterized protein n=1 Tax=Leucobacter komagatae TaxID=55969 RepID=A0A0D0IPJ7_9MICO|nr:hypothetical protein [Leucobacter komagatae]KIP53494.1 hypothetical protein SD72_01950 [Leucobacter komagatae]